MSGTGVSISLRLFFSKWKEKSHFRRNLVRLSKITDDYWLSVVRLRMRIPFTRREELPGWVCWEGCRDIKVSKCWLIKIQWFAFSRVQVSYPDWYCSTICGVVCKDGIILGTEKIVINKMMVSGTDKRAFSITKQVGCVSTNRTKWLISIPPRSIFLTI